MGAHLSNSFSFNSQGLHLREVVVIGHHVSDDGFLVRVVHTDICNRGEESLQYCVHGAATQAARTPWSKWSTLSRPVSSLSVPESYSYAFHPLTVYQVSTIAKRYSRRF